MKRKAKTNYYSSLIINILLAPFYLIKWIILYLKERIKISIRFKISAVYAKILFSLMILSSFIIVFIFGYFQFTYITDRNNNILENQLGDENQDIEIITKVWDEAGLKVILLDKDKNIVSSIVQFKISDYKKSVPFFLQTINSERYIGIHKKITINDQSYIALVFHSYNIIFNNFLKLLYTVLIINGCVLIITIVKGIHSNEIILQPIGEMTNTVKNISANNLNLRINVTGSQDELKELAITFNEMLERIESSYEIQKQFVSDASHELRTPISVLQGYANMLDRWGKNDSEVLQESIDAIINESSYMKELVEKLLFLARHDRGTLKIEKRPFEVRDLVEEICKETKIIDEDHEIECNFNDLQEIQGDRNLIKQALRIFIDNSRKYTPSEGKITLESYIEEDNVIINIKDNGIGISKDELAKIFNRFYRSDKSRNKIGQGLGLPIAKIIILSHNGKINVRSKLGVGTEFRIIIPIDQN